MTGNKCMVADSTGYKNLSLLSQQDKDLYVGQNKLIRYSLCGPLSQSCNNQTNVTACLIINGKEFILGKNFV